MVERSGLGAHAACGLVADGQESGGEFVAVQPGQPLTHSRRHSLSLRLSGDSGDPFDCFVDQSSLMLSAIGTFLPGEWYH